MQFPNGEIISECPISYFGHEVNQIFKKYSNFKVMKGLGIVTNAENVPLIDIEAYATIEVELNKCQDYRMEQDRKKQKRKK